MVDVLGGEEKGKEQRGSVVSYPAGAAMGRL